MAPKRARRTAEERITDLKAEIERIKARSVQQMARKDPTLRHISGAVRAIDKAMGETRDKATRSALMEARATLSACLALNGADPVRGGREVVSKPRAAAPPDSDQVLEYIRGRPGSRSEEICGELGTDAASLRPVLHRLRDTGKVKVEGKARATKYSVIS